MPNMNDQEEWIITVDGEDCQTGVAPKLEAHREGLRHRAISVFVCDDKGRFLLQKRYVGKYHSGGLWTNSCCSHPRPGETVKAAAERRLLEEMGFSSTLSFLFKTQYEAPVGNGLIENEIVHVFGGHYSGAIQPHPQEAEGYAWVDLKELQQDLLLRQQHYSVWLHHYMAHFSDRLEMLKSAQLVSTQS